MINTDDSTRRIVSDTSGVVRLTGTSTCQTSASCTGTADEVVSSVSYGPQTAGTGNNLLPVSTSQGAGDGSLTATVTTGYDTLGNAITLDGPLAGTADVTRRRYNAARELVGSVSADPDGSGPLRHHATRNIIDARGLVTRIEDGTVTSQTDGAWANFDDAEAVEITYDTLRRPVLQRLVNGTTTYGLSQTSYDSAGRVECVVQRMNLSATAPANACALGTTGGFGPDRITRTTYDAANRPLTVTTGYGTADAGVEISRTYDDFGRLESVNDGQQNETGYSYDGHGRLRRTSYPAAATGAINPADYEELSYDAAGNVTERRLRDASEYVFTYDRLNRLSTKDLPGTEPTVTYGYDLLGRPLSVSRPGETLSFTWDALGRNLTQVSPQGTVTSAYDLAGRRTKLTYPGSGLFIEYEYQVTGEMTRVRENGATTVPGVLATYAYDSRGRRLSLTRGNGTVQTYSYDPVSRLSQLADNFTGTGDDQTLGFTYNPASQIATNTRSNDLFAAPVANGTVATPVNRLNHVTQVSAAATTHDARGNMTNDGTSLYTYSSENLLLTGPSTTLTYDPLMRLSQATEAGTITRFGYDGDRMIAEFTSANAVSRRYVHGAGVDEPLVQYEGTGTANRRWLHADERGSIVAHSDHTGAVTQVNRYDEYGVSAAGNAGRFGYTGQAWLPILKLYYYRARMYNPQLGRFMQADPIGYGDGMNIYAYVSGDPVNRIDPSGLSTPNCGSPAKPCTGPDLPVTGRLDFGGLRPTEFTPINGFSGGGEPLIPDEEDIVVTGCNGTLILDVCIEDVNFTLPATPEYPSQCPAVPAWRDIGDVGLVGAMVRDPTGMIMASTVRGIANQESETAFPSMSGNGTSRDAFRHFFGSFALTRLIGSERAMNILNAVEVSGGNSSADRDMDTFNNHVASQMAQDPRSQGRRTRDLAHAALALGCLRVNR